MTTFTCPSCGKTIGAEVPPGSAVTCPLCNSVVIVPAGAPTGMPQAATPPTQAPWPMHQPQPLRQGMAIASMALGILSIVTTCFPVFGLIALILGIVAIKRANRSPAEYGGKGFAIAGIVTSLVSLAFTILFGLFVMLGVMAGMHSATSQKAQIKLTEAAIGPNGEIGTSLSLFKLEMGRYPTTTEGLGALVTRPDGLTQVECTRWQKLIRNRARLDDPWGHPYRYRCPGEENPDSYDLWSDGPDGQPNTSDDIGNWPDGTE